MEMDEASGNSAGENNNADGVIMVCFSAVIGYIRALPQSIERIEDKKTVCTLANLIIGSGTPILKSNPSSHSVAHAFPQTSLLPFIAPNDDRGSDFLISSDYPTVKKIANKELTILEHFEGGGHLGPYDVYSVTCRIISIALDAAFCCGAVTDGTRLMIPTSNSSLPLPNSTQAYPWQQSPPNSLASSLLMNLSRNKSVGTDASIPVDAGDALDGLVGGSASDDDDGQCFDAWFRKHYAMTLTEQHKKGEKSAIHACFYGYDKLGKPISQKEMNACRAKKHRKKKVMEEQIRKLKMRMDWSPEHKCEVYVGDTHSGGFIEVEPQTSSAQVREMGSPGSSGTFFEGFIMKSWAGLDAIENTRRKVAVPCEVRDREGRYKRLTGCIGDKILVESSDGQNEWIDCGKVLDSMTMLVEA